MSKIEFPEDNRNLYFEPIEMVHAIILRMIKIISLVSKKYDLPFWLEYGTLLGAVRHKGFIPWDTEADIGMMRFDFEQMKKVIQKELPDDIFFQDENTDPYYTQSHLIEAKFRDKYSNYRSFKDKHPDVKWHNGIQVDIFVYDQYILDGELCFINSYELNLTRANSYYLPNEIAELKECDFEDSIFFIPAGYNEYLKRNYNNYMELPPPKERIIEQVEPMNPCTHKEILYWGANSH